MDNLYCTGREKNLTDCHFDGWGNHDCEPTEIAGVVCKVLPKAVIIPAKSPTDFEKLKAHGPNRIKSGFEVRLGMGRTEAEGRVEVSKAVTAAQVLLLTEIFIAKTQEIIKEHQINSLLF